MLRFHSRVTTSFSGTIRHTTARRGAEPRGLAVDRISAHEVRLLLAFQRNADAWLTNAEADEVSGISPTTARLHMSRLVRLGVRDVERLFPANRFRLGKHPDDEGKAYLERWEKAREIYWDDVGHACSPGKTGGQG